MGYLFCREAILTFVSFRRILGEARERHPDRVPEEPVPAEPELPSLLFRSIKRLLRPSHPRSRVMPIAVNSKRAYPSSVATRLLADMYTYMCLHPCRYLAPKAYAARASRSALLALSTPLLMTVHLPRALCNAVHESTSRLNELLCAKCPARRTSAGRRSYVGLYAAVTL